MPATHQHTAMIGREPNASSNELQEDLRGG